ncbi:Sulfide:quinone oxidoreductase, mitochondrial [Nymphon striatum]|nr:Sulfide:quinone oxidoreductase, mitochondrial [Nymphon striatum]
MEIKTLTAGLSVSAQINPADLKKIRDAGFRAIICNRPDGEGADQPTFEEIAKAAKKAGVEVAYLPIVAGKVTDEDAAAFDRTLTELPGPIKRSVADILAATKAAGYDMGGVVRRIVNGGKTPTDTGDASFEVVIVGAGAGGIAAAASLKARQPGLEIAIIDPADVHYYQPGWTMVGGGIFEPKQTSRTMGSLIPQGVHWIQSAVAAFEPENNAIILDGCRVVKYTRLIVCPGLKLDWNKVEGLVDTLGQNGAEAIFTQPPMPIKCAGAPQKAMYLSGDAWHRRGVLKNIDIQFNNAGGVLFGVKDYVPALMEYVKKYDATLNFFHNLVAVDGPAKKAWFDVAKPDSPVERVEMEFDMMHVCPPQTAPDFIRVSPLADAAGWIDVDQATLAPQDLRQCLVAG